MISTQVKNKIMLYPLLVGDLMKKLNKSIGLSEIVGDNIGVKWVYSKS